ncbi:putative transcriptional regulator [Pseudobythopirellula maris]|uniref:Putative transcriptional regulator n=1 Tax=Pseudobythopirellula maris TaxID=2527991 RepID=A0A5C5ZKQ8_9BACT|nr:TetR/AcrR family transcriptional regulator [Pseudobythopirellula maris]TWT87735.1 putative transcriptional regulator [Pseudobythopirellula maris]
MAATELYYAHGIAQVGLDKILQQAELTKTTFYNHFESKDELVREVLNGHAVRILSQIQEGVAARTHDDPRHVMLSVFDVVEEFYSGTSENSCLFISAAITSPGPQDPTNAAAMSGRQEVRGLLLRLAREAGVENVEAFAEQFGLIFDGACILRQIDRNPQAMALGRRLAAMLLDAHASQD